MSNHKGKVRIHKSIISTRFLSKVNKDRLLKTITYNLKRQRKLYRYNQSELADLAGMTRASICNFEKGKSFPSLTALLKLAYVFNQTLDDFLQIKITEKGEKDKMSFLFRHFGDILKLDKYDQKYIKATIQRLLYEQEHYDEIVAEEKKKHKVLFTLDEDEKND
jgi:transcriptional regulator with XRE-family HTH domain